MKCEKEQNLSPRQIAASQLSLSPKQQIELFRQLQEQGRCFYLTIRGSCMAPLIQSGDTVTVRPTAPDKLGISDIALLNENDELVAHRIVAAGRDEAGFFIRSQGDNAETPGPKVRRHDILGQIVGVSRKEAGESLGEGPPMARLPLRKKIIQGGHRASEGAIVVVLFIISIFWISFWTQGLPFYLEDYEWLLREEPISNVLVTMFLPLNPTAETLSQTRPLAVLIYHVLWNWFGDHPPFFHASKNALCSLLIVGVYLLARKNEVPRGPAFVAALFLSGLTPIMLSTWWVCDIEIVASLLVVATAYLVMPGYEAVTLYVRSPRKDYLRLAAVLVLGWLAVSTKETGCLVVAITFAGGLANAWGMRRLWLVTAVVLAFFGVGRVVSAALHSPLSFYGQVPSLKCFRFEVHQFINVLRTPLLIAGLLAIIVAVKRLYRKPARLLGRSIVRRRVERQTLFLFGVWGACVFIGWFFTPCETRLLVPSIVVSVCAGVYLVKLSLRNTPRTLRATLGAFLLFALLNALVTNAAYLINYRGTWGSHFVAAARTVRYIDTHYSGAVVRHSHFLPLLLSPNKSNHFIRLSRCDTNETESGAILWVHMTSPPEGEGSELMMYRHCCAVPRDAEVVRKFTGRSSALFDELAESLNVGIDFVPLDSMTNYGLYSYPTVYTLIEVPAVLPSVELAEVH